MVVKLPKATIKRMFNEFHPDFRISGEALNRLEVVIGDFTRMTIADAVKLAEHGGRKTLQEKDVILATS
jgi:histone H3/H4